MTKRPNLDQSGTSPYRARMEVEPFVSAQQVAQILGMSKNWIYLQATEGDLPSYKFGKVRKFRLSEIKDWVKSQQQREEQT